MSRWVGLREEQREGEVLATLILEFWPVGPRWTYREQARSHTGSVLLHTWSQQHQTLWERACSRRGQPKQ